MNNSKDGYYVENSMPFNPGVTVGRIEHDQTVELIGKECSCGVVLEFQVRHELSHTKMSPTIGGSRSIMVRTPVYESIKQVKCPSCHLVYSIEVYREWLKARREEGRKTRNDSPST